MILRKIRHVYRIFKIYIKEIVQNIKYTGFTKNDDNYIKWRLLLLAHSLEKGLSLCENKPNFGIKKATDLLNMLIKMQNQNDSFEYCESYSVITKYKEYRVKNGLDSSFLLELSKIEKPTLYCEVGYKLEKKEELLYDFNHFKDLCNKRHSIREYADSLPYINDIIDVINVASKAPSACNRQMIKVFFSDTIEDNIELAKYIPGNTGTKGEKCVYIFVAADRTAFDYFEAEQWMLNGGIFTSYLVLGFTAKGLGSCIYQWPIQYENTKKVKKLLNIPQKYAILTAVSVGIYKDEVKYLVSCRRKVDELYKVNS